ncbi:S8 family serine peptidase [Plantactinospora sp. B24E8]|uniref:S8 family peptidase n=1 Tax=Plantactinospora sp. B24E8 TaxID=3153567 RepID=UPI00325EB0BD
MRMRPALSGLLAAVTVSSGAVVPEAVASPVVAQPPVSAGVTVTLLTGDTVTVSGTRVLNVRAAHGREHMVFHTYTDERGDINVVPEDAQALLAQGKLDPRLFNVTELVEAGFDDTLADRLPLIVDHAGPAPRSTAARVSRELPAVGATALSVERSAAYWPTARTADRVWLDGRVRAALEHSVPQVGAPAAWAAGHTGAGTTVAVLDTGVDATHPDLADAVVDARDFTGGADPDDRNGHGTHVASIVTGADPRHRGVAPDTRILNVKVLADDGFGSESAVLAGMEWAASQGADVINMSLGGGPSDGTDPLSQAVNELTARTGALFVVAAGNEPAYVDLPGTADAALTVGAVNRDDELAEFSGRGPRLLDGAIKPDITAPGVDIVAARASNGVLGEPGQSHMPLSGTSMAAPHVAGAAAILAGAHPDWSPDQIKATLMGNAVPKDGLTVFEQGAGRLDLAAAVRSTVVASPTNLNLGAVRWPHHDNTPISRTLTYTNLGTGPVSLDLAADVVSEDGAPAPEGMFTFAPASLTVPAGGQASTTVTADTSFDGPTGAFTGVVVATRDASSGGGALRTPVAVHREIESYDVTVSAIGYDGAPSDEYRYRFVPIDHVGIYKGFATGPITLRLPRGEYTYTGYVPDAATGRLADFAEPTFMVTQDTEVVYDVRETVPVDITIDDPTARHVHSQLDYGRELGNGRGYVGTTTLVPAGRLPDLTVKPSATRHDDFTFTVETLMARWNGESFDNSPYLYQLKRVDNGISRTPGWHDRRQELAHVRSEHATSTPGATGLREFDVTVPLPVTLDEYYTPDVPWNFRSFNEVIDGDIRTQFMQYAPTVFRRGRTTAVRWNVGVFGPAMAGAQYGGGASFRNQDQLYLQQTLVSDQGRGRWGDGFLPGKTQLLRDGEVIGESDEATRGVFEVGPEDAVYTVRTTADRSAYARLSTRIDVEWTFASQRHDDPLYASYLPLLAVRYAPDLDNENAAPAGEPFTIPVSVQRNGSDHPGQISTLTVEVSYDDGRSWKPVTVTRQRGQWAVTVDHPVGAEFVSLRSAVTDSDGNAQDQTIIRAYALR